MVLGSFLGGCHWHRSRPLEAFASNPSTAETGYHCCSSSSEPSQWDSVAAGRRRNIQISIAALEGISTAYSSLPLHPSPLPSTTQERGDCASGRGSVLLYTNSPIRLRFLLCKRKPSKQHTSRLEEQEKEIRHVSSAGVGALRQ